MSGGKTESSQGARHSVSLLELASRMPGVLMDAPVILRGAMTGLLARPTTRTSIGKVFQDRAARHGDRNFLRFGAEKLTYREANEAVNRYAHVLTQRGVRRGDVVGVMLRNSPNAVLVTLAAVKCGAVAGMLNYNQRGDALAHSIGLLNAKVIVAEADLVHVIGESGSSGPEPMAVEDLELLAVGAPTGRSKASFAVKIGLASNTYRGSKTR